ncbi:MAG: transcriptional repressor [Oscillospiraceae bacterium]|nr:transcriptional repressor [Oscillospiraceae bacterium]
MTYRTKQKDCILAYLRAHSGAHVTAEELAERLKGQVGKTTIYRYLDSLADEGAVLRYASPGRGSACYQLASDEAGNVYHLLCTGCGEMRHLSCGQLEGLAEHMREDHRFLLDMRQTVLYGQCEKCRKATCAATHAYETAHNAVHTAASKTARRTAAEKTEKRA